MNEKIKLRGHHLICLHFLNKGYSPEFSGNAKSIYKRWGKQKAEIVKGFDDVCAHCPGRKFIEPYETLLTGTSMKKREECAYYGNEEIEFGDKEALELLGLKVGDTVSRTEVIEKLPKILPEWRKRHCYYCPLEKTCEEKQQDVLSASRSIKVRVKSANSTVS